MIALPPRRQLQAVVRLRWLLALLLLAIAIPSAILVRSTWQQLKWEAFHQARTQAEELATRIDGQLQAWLGLEEQRAAADYGFLRIAGQPGLSNLLQMSPLARFPVQAEFPGLLGWFQIDGDGQFSSPVLPADPATAGLDPVELQQRSALRDQLYSVLRSNQLAVATRVADKDRVQETLAESQAVDAEQQQLAFDQLQSRGRVGNAIARVDELRLQQNYQGDTAQRQLIAAEPPPAAQLKDQSPRSSRKEQSANIEGYSINEAVQPLAKLEAKRVNIFEAELDPFEFSLLGDGHALLYRRVWQSGQRLVQGAILQQSALLETGLSGPYRQTALAGFTDLLIAWRGDVVQLSPGLTKISGSSTKKIATELQGELLYQIRLSAPFDELQLIWHLRELPAAPGASLLAWTSLVLAAILAGSFLLLYRLGLKQLKLGQQRQDFVSAVSHELNTPLTSIRMYAEILLAGWADPEKQRGYFEFIHAESERLSRLISNVLQLARLERNEQPLETRATSVPTLFDMLQSRISSQVQRAGVELHCTLDPALQNPQSVLQVDTDAIVQIIINLVDNALKFAAATEPRRLDLGAQLHGRQQLLLTVRDYGPGIDAGQLRQIFELFYRSANQLTREKPGTGIGLALVRQLARAHGGDVEVENRNPGAEFRVILPLSAR